MKRFLWILGWIACLLLGLVCLLGAIADDRHLLFGVLALACAAGMLWTGRKYKTAASFAKAKAKWDRLPQAEKNVRVHLAGAEERRAAARAELNALSPEERAARFRQMAAARVPKSDAEKTGEFDREYTCVGIFRPAEVTGPMPAVGDYLEPEEEPGNPYDSGAILLRDLNGEPVGYFNRGKLREAVRIGLEQGAALVVQVSRADDKLEVYVGIDKAE